MASTALADIIQSSPITSYVPAALPDHITLVSSGAAVMDYESLAAQGGDFISIRKFAEDTAANEVNDGSISTPGNLASYKDIAAILHRKRVRAVDDVVKAALGRQDANAVNDEIARQNVYYWSKAMQTSMMNVLAGAFDPSTGVLLATHVSNVGVATGTPVTGSFGALIDAAVLLGDNMRDFVAMITPSKVYANLVKENAAKITSQYFGQREQLFYNGMAVFIDDTFTVTGSDPFKVYTTFLVRAGALFFSVQRQMTIDYEMQALYPREILTTTLDYAAHIRGVKWGVTTTNPTDAALATASNWTKVASNKEIGIVAFRSNAN